VQAHIVEDLLPADVGKHGEDVHLLEARADSLAVAENESLLSHNELLSVQLNVISASIDMMLGRAEKINNNTTRIISDKRTRWDGVSGNISA
jgi:hypothetical protein